MSPHSSARAAASQRNGAASRGPVTPEGKAKSALSAVKHGLTSKNLLLPGEDAAEYESFVSAWFEALCPANLPEGQIVALAADCAWRLERLARVENALSQRRLDERLAETSSHRAAKASSRLVTMLNALSSALAARPVAPCTFEEAAPLLDGMNRMTPELAEVPDFDSDLRADFELAVSHVWSAARDGKLSQPLYADLLSTVTSVLEAAQDLSRSHQAALAPVREQLALELLLLDSEDLRRLDRHRKLLENSLRRQLDLLDSVRRSVLATDRRSDARPEELRVKLRLVR